MTSAEMWEYLLTIPIEATVVYLALPVRFVETGDLDERERIAMRHRQCVQEMPALARYARVSMYDFVGVAEADIERIRSWAVAMTQRAGWGRLDGYWGLAMGPLDAERTNRLFGGTNKMAAADPSHHVFLLHSDGWVRPA